MRDRDSIAIATIRNNSLITLRSPLAQGPKWRSRVRASWRRTRYTLTAAAAAKSKRRAGKGGANRPPASGRTWRRGRGRGGRPLRPWSAIPLDPLHAPPHPNPYPHMRTYSSARRSPRLRAAQPRTWVRSAWPWTLTATSTTRSCTRRPTRGSKGCGRGARGGAQCGWLGGGGGFSGTDSASHALALNERTSGVRWVPLHVLPCSHARSCDRVCVATGRCTPVERGRPPGVTISNLTLSQSAPSWSGA